MARSLRLVYRDQQGTNLRKNFNWPPIHERAAVILTAAQWRPAGGLFGELVGRPVLDQAKVYVTNVGPHDPEGGDGGVEFFLNVESNTPVDVIVTITVLEDVE